MDPRNTIRRGFAALIAALTLSLSAACADQPAPGDDPAAGDMAQPAPTEVSGTLQGTSLLGDPLYSIPDTTGMVEEADMELGAAPDDVELIIAAGRVRRNFQQYREAIELYDRAAELAPNDWRPYRFRGHRRISVREFDAAVTDLERARELAPNNWDVAYHLGLAYFLSGRFDDAAAEYLRCMAQTEEGELPAAGGSPAEFRACAVNLTDPESRVAMTEWAYRALRRSDRDEEAQSLLDGLPADLDIQTNVAYYEDLLFYKGLRTAEELLNPGPDAPYRLETVGYGIANWYVAEGDTAAAVSLLERLVEDPMWAGFGRIAAEVELVRLRGG